MVLFSNYFLSFPNPNKLLWFWIPFFLWSVALGKIFFQTGKKNIYLEEYFFHLEHFFPIFLQKIQEKYYHISWPHIVWIICSNVIWIFQEYWGQEKWISKTLQILGLGPRICKQKYQFTFLGLSILEKFKIKLDKFFHSRSEQFW